MLKSLLMCMLRIFPGEPCKSNTYILMLALLLTKDVTLGKSLNFCRPCFLHL